MDLNILVSRCRKGDELAQEIFVKMYRGLRSFKNQDAFTGWMLTLGRHCCLDRIRHKKARIKTEANELEEFQHPRDDNHNPEESWQQNQRKTTLYRAIDTQYKSLRPSTLQ